MDENIDIKEIFQEAFGLYKNALQPLITLGLIYAIATEAGQVILKKLPFVSSGTQFIANMFISSFVSIALVYTASQIYQNKPVDLNQAFASIKGKYWNYVTVSIAFFLVVLLGVAFFIIPGAYFGTLFVFADLLVVLENKVFIEAFKRSADLVRGHFWQVFLFSLITAGLMIPGVLLGSISFNGINLGRMIQMCLMVFIVPFITMVQVGLYLHMKKLYESQGRYE